MPNTEADNLFSGLKAIVQYRRRYSEGWLAMAAYDSFDLAKKYAADCAKDNGLHWEYRAIKIPQNTVPPEYDRDGEVVRPWDDRGNA